jgi:hypothetical protein
VINRSVQRGIRQLGLGALLLPFLLLATISHQVMPLRSAEGALMLVLCPGEDQQQVHADHADHAAHMSHGADDPEQTEHRNLGGLCDWACANSVLALTDLPALPRAALRLVPFHPEPLSLTLAVARKTGLPPATGPPLAA